MRLGVLLPHFGRHTNTSWLLEAPAQLEILGFDSAWARDHIVYRPHPFEDQDITFVDPMMTLAAAAARTERLILGTATMIPFRHPIHSAMQLASLAVLAGPKRLIICWGMGNDRREFEATGNVSLRPGARLDEHVEVTRELLSGRAVTHHGAHYRLDDVQLKGTAQPLTFWYGGRSPRAMERTVAHYDGLLASRIPRAVLAHRMGYLAELADAAGRPRPDVGVVTLVSPAETVEQALAYLDVEHVRTEIAARFAGDAWPAGPGLDGVMLTGPPALIVEELLRFAQMGIGHVVMDLRARFADWESVIAVLAERVLPEVRRERVAVGE